MFDESQESKGPTPVPNGNDGGKTIEQWMTILGKGHPFQELPTMFKLPVPGPLSRIHVECVACEEPFSLRDILDGELEETECPACGVTSREYYR